MKLLLQRLVLTLSAVAALAASTAARATTPDQLCSSLYDDSLKAQCVAIVVRNHFDEAGVTVCASVYDDTLKFSCLRQIANLRFNGGAAQVCASIYDDTSKVSCLANAGVPAGPNGGGCPTYDALRNSLYGALDALNRNDPYSTGSDLQAMLNSLQGC